MQTGLMQFLRRIRMAGDTIFAIGAFAYVYFVIDLIFERPKTERLRTAVPEIAIQEAS
jgi:nitric oxide reductase large subunit